MLLFQGVVTLLQHPSQLKDLKADPSFARPFVEELCRFHTTSSFATRRVAKVDITIGDKVRIVLLLNRASILLIFRNDP